VYYSCDTATYQQKREKTERKSMKSIKLNALKVLAVVVLLCPAVFADGDMGSGGFADSGLPTAKTGASLDGDMGSGGLNDSGSDAWRSALSSIYDYLESMI
jgi:hypothetical protein